MKLEQEVLPNLKADEAMLGRGYFEYLTFFFFLHSLYIKQPQRNITKPSSKMKVEL